MPSSNYPQGNKNEYMGQTHINKEIKPLVLLTVLWEERNS